MQWKLCARHLWPERLAPERKKGPRTQAVTSVATRPNPTLQVIDIS
jgi:hypothetical protein